MRWWGYLLLAFLAFITARVGGEVYAGVRVAGDTPREALADYLRYASLGSELYLFVPFLVVGALCGWFAMHVRQRSVLAIFAAAIAVLGYLYIYGHWAAEMALREERWTAAALTVGFLPFMGIPVVLVAALLGLVATRFDARDA